MQNLASDWIEPTSLAAASMSSVDASGWIECRVNFGHQQ
jgi:hypothetical protein